MHKSILILFLILSNFLTAQNPTNAINVVGQGDFSNGLWVINSNESHNRIDGSPYLFSDWFQKGKIYFEDKIYIVNELNYNIQLERFEAKVSNDSVFAFDRGDVKKVEINDKLFTRFLDPDFQRNTYFENVVDFKDKKILKKYIIKLKEGQTNPMTMQKIQQDKFIKSEQFYILKEGENKLSKVKLKKKSILSLIEDAYISKVKEFVKSNGFSFNKVQDLTKILNYYNSLG